MEDPEIVAAVLAGDIDAYAELVSRYHRQLYYFVIGKISHEMEAEDLVQKAFVTAYCKLADFDPGQPFIRWLRGIAVNYCRNEWKRVERQARLHKRLLEERLAGLNLRDLEGEAQADESRLTALRACMERLSDSEKTLMQRRFIEEVPLTTLAASFGKDSEAIRLSLFRLRQRLRACVLKFLTVGGSHE
jgi:RNA polymerase sigma-70 factor (ECF subfamily)